MICAARLRAREAGSRIFVASVAGLEKLQVLRIESAERRFHARSNPDDPLLHTRPKECNPKITAAGQLRPAQRRGTAGMSQRVRIHFLHCRERRAAAAMNI